MELTTKQIAQQYSACMDSVNLINKGKRSDQSDEDWADTVERNKSHLASMLTRDYWTTENLKPIQDACAQNEATELAA